MTETIDLATHQAAVAEARREGAAAVKRRAVKLTLGIFAIALVLLVTAIGAGWSLATRAQIAAPEVIEQIASERQAVIEARLAERTREAQALVGQTFEFLHTVWEQNEALRQLRAHVDAVKTQTRLLSAEVNAAFDSPTRHLVGLLENGPTRARAVLEHAIAVGTELRRLIPVVLNALGDASRAANTADGQPALPTILDSMDALLEPFIGTNAKLEGKWASLKRELLGWTERVADDMALARAEVTGEQLSIEFLQRLRDRIL